MANLASLFFVGDSLTGSTMYYPYGSAGISHAQVPGDAGSNSTSYQFWTFNNENVLCLNTALGGRKLSNMTAAFATEIQALINTNYPGNPPLSKWDSTRPNRKLILSLMAGTNADTTDPDTLAANVATYIATARAAGINKIILCPILSRTDGGWIGSPGSTTFDTTTVIPYNTKIVDPTWMAANGVDAVPRWDQEPLICAAGAANNATYFIPVDPMNPQNGGIHPTQAGASLMYPYFVTALNTVLASL
jgi:hypothetical protein